MEKCSSCGKELTEGARSPKITWDSGTVDWFCDQECVISYMADNGVRWANPNAQES